MNNKSISTKKSGIVLKFAQTLADYGDMFFSTGDVEQDYNLITSTIDGQGYWAGTSARYIFDKKFNLIRTEERMFGHE